jgi:hypothetical protein
MKLLDQIKENSKNISDSALILQLDSASNSNAHLYFGDVTLSRIINSISVILKYNFHEYFHESLIVIQVRANILNTLRNSFDYKPDGFDQLLKEIQDSFLIGCVDAGLGNEQLSKLCWLFNYTTLKEESLLYLREMSNIKVD